MESIDIAIRRMVDRIRYRKKKGLDIESFYDALYNLYAYKGYSEYNAFCIEVESQNLSVKEARKQRQKDLNALRHIERKEKKGTQKKVTQIKDSLLKTLYSKKLQFIETLFNFFGCTKVLDRGKEKSYEDDIVLGNMEETEKRYAKLIRYAAKRYSGNSKEQTEDLCQEGLILLHSLHNVKKSELGENAFGAYFKTSLFRMLKEKQDSQKLQEQKVLRPIEVLEEKQGIEDLTILSEEAQKVLELLKEGWKLEELVIEGYRRSELNSIIIEIEKAS